MLSCFFVTLIGCRYKAHPGGSTPGQSVTFAEIHQQFHPYTVTASCLSEQPVLYIIIILPFLKSPASILHHFDELLFPDDDDDDDVLSS